MARPRIEEAARSSGAKPCFAKCASLTLLTQGLQQQAALLVSM
jgi:hypothetical protein